MADLSSKIVATAARLWGKKPGAIQVVHRNDRCDIEVWTWIDEEDPDLGMLSYRVYVRPSGANDDAYQAELMHALLDVLEGALRRKATGKAMVARATN